ncbi:MAG: ABC transporter substrate-binding protein [Burkholderiales bacterium]|nr:ABC transporter substrate-binding protein [Burkholderiales bacterium]
MRVAAKLLACLALSLCTQAWAVIDIVDDRGISITLPAAPKRIVSLLPSLTETVCELGACGRLVGVDSFSNWPAQAAQLPRVGGVDDASIETIVGLKPDVVLLGGTSRAASRLEGLGITVIGLEPRTLSDVQRVLAKVGRLLQVDRADAVWRRLNADIDTAARSVPPGRRGTSVYFEIGSDGYAASASSHIGEILMRLGATNVVPGNLGTVPKLNPEFVVRADPELIMVSDRTVASLKQRPGWSRVRAVRNGRICGFDAAQNDVIMRPGPRLAEAARLMAACLKGELR